MTPVLGIGWTAFVGASAATSVLLIPLDNARAQSKPNLPMCSKVEGNDGGPLRALSTFTVSEPAVGQARSVEIGQPLVSSIEMSELPDVLILKEPISYVGRGPAAGFSISVPAGVLKVSRDTRDFVLYRAEAGSALKDGKKVEATIDVVRKTDKESLLRVSWIHHFSSIFAAGSQPFADDIPGASYEIRGCIGPVTKNYRREIVYAGVSGRSVSLLYREFSGDLARPAFSQNLTYDLSAGDEIGYKGARLKISNATNTAITFEVTRTLE